MDNAPEIDDDCLEALETLRDISTDLDNLARLTRNLKKVRKALVRSVWDQNGLTLREAAQVFGIPKSTLQDWATKGDWLGGRGR